VIGGVVHASCQLIIAVAAMRQPALFAGAPLLLGLSIVTAVSIGIVCDNLDAPAKRLMQANKRSDADMKRNRVLPILLMLLLGVALMALGMHGQKNSEVGSVGDCQIHRRES